MQTIDNHIFRSVLDYSQVGIILHRNGEILYSNNQVNHILEEDVSESLNLTIFDYLSPDYKDIVLKRIEEMINGLGDWMKGDYPVRLKNGSQKVVRTSARLIDKETQTILLEITDITREKITERENKFYRLKMESVLDEAPISILILSEEGEIQFINKKVIQGRNIERKGIQGMFIKDFITYQKSDPVFNRLYFAFQNKINLKEVFSYKKKNDQTIWLELNVKYISQEKQRNFIVLIQDVSELKAMEQKIKGFNDELKRKVQENISDLEIKTKKLKRGQQAMIYLLEDMKEIQKEINAANRKMEVMNADLESFNYSVSHDLKAHLRVITNYSNFLMEDLSGKIEEESFKMLKEIESQGKNMSQLLTDLLHFSRFGNAHLKKTKIDMKELVSALFSEELRVHDRADKFEIIIDNLPEISGDYSLIKQVVVNLVANAVKFTKNEEKPKIHVGFVENKNEIKYYFKDNGIGFAEEKSSYIFNVFKRLNNSVNQEGTGIGLAIVKRIIEKHDGKVYASGISGKGAEIGFVLPKIDVK